MSRVFVCSCFGVTEEQVREHAAAGACTPRQIASSCRAGTDCGGCVRRIQALLGRGAGPRRAAVAAVAEAAPGERARTAAEALPRAGRAAA
ncbi:(2Fe-2S)-binding protein [Streptomyces sp. SCUT-3]|uniref:(2Fe-2S)-binding protein n=1 Tax=Streptomyces sp. SCUT-3 TaxID=2684469 RepID=UPI0015FEA888|nr:(2Fe-2S)-binding protein [Streptomyces sp. SCUT-3]QMV23792.1 (2Fe-2S)-binding protein [Streptomyces sp. SCUT-3]